MFAGQTSEPIAIVGMSCRVPGAADLAAFWRLLSGGGEAISTVPPDRWDAEAYYDPDPAAPGKMNSKCGGFLDQVDQFDSAFFGIAPREADLMDPQHRLMLETTWEALENAAIVPSSLAGRPIGVFVGLASANYAGLLHDDPAQIGPFTNSGGSGCIAANRISYTLDLRGPSIAIDTACSSSLVAVHLACQSLWTGESELAIAGGANVILSPGPSISLAKARMLSPDGRCRVFDAGANGFGRAEGAGMIVLKLLSRALADGDPIHAVIRGSATQQNGKTNGLMAPNRWAQEAVVRQACRSAGISPGAFQYVEAHSSGTLIGDATEINALAAVLQKDRASDRKCAVGSVKTNIGHLEAASGIAGLIKVVLMLQQGQLAPSLHYAKPNPHISNSDLPLRIQSELAPWPIARDERAIAGVSASGYGGVNVHVVLEAPPKSSRPASSNGQTHVLVLSARTAGALRALARRYVDWLGEARDTSVADACYTAATGRTHFAHRLAPTVVSLEDAQRKLLAFLDAQQVDGLRDGIVARRAAPASQSNIDLASRFVAGEAIDWFSIYAASHARRIAIPTVAFDRQRHWLPIAENSNSATVQKRAPARPRRVARDTGHEIVAPQSSTERTLVNIWQHVLGVENVGITDDFFELGGGSLMVLEMFALVAKEFHVELAPSTLFERPTIEQLACLIDEHRSTIEAPALVSIRPGDGDNGHPPVFLVAPDHLLHYTQLIRRFDPAVPLFGLQPPFADGFREPGMTIEQMAEVYVKEIENVYPAGICHVVGLCAGGVIAFEMAQRLRERGRAMGLLAMIDAPCPPSQGQREIGRAEYLIARGISHVRALRELSAREAMRYVAVRARLMFGATVGPAKRLARPTEQSAAISGIANRAAIYRYRPRRYDGRVELFNARVPYPSNAEDTRVRWRELARDARLFWLAGDHSQIMYAPQVDQIVEQVEEALETIDAAPKPAQRKRPSLATQVA